MPITALFRASLPWRSTPSILQPHQDFHSIKIHFFGRLISIPITPCVSTSFLTQLWFPNPTLELLPCQYPECLALLPLYQSNRTPALVSYPFTSGLHHSSWTLLRKMTQICWLRLGTNMTTNLTWHCQRNLLHFLRKFNFPVSGETIPLPFLSSNLQHSLP